MRYSLSTLMIVAGIAPPALAFLWLFWRVVLFLAICGLVLWLWVVVGLAVARFLAGIVVSPMD